MGYRTYLEGCYLAMRCLPSCDLTGYSRVPRPCPTSQVRYPKSDDVFDRVRVHAGRVVDATLQCSVDEPGSLVRPLDDDKGMFGRVRFIPESIGLQSNTPFSKVTDPSAVIYV
jgi:hypothetical protein